LSLIRSFQFSIFPICYFLSFTIFVFLSFFLGRASILSSVQVQSHKNLLLYKKKRVITLLSN
jgi:hypothetical protein